MYVKNNSIYIYAYVIIYIYNFLFMTSPGRQWRAQCIGSERFGRSWGGKHNRTPKDTLLEAWLFYIYTCTCICTPQNFTDRILYPATPQSYIITHIYIYTYHVISKSKQPQNESPLNQVLILAMEHHLLHNPADRIARKTLKRLKREFG